MRVVRDDSIQRIGSDHELASLYKLPPRGQCAASSVRVMPPDAATAIDVSVSTTAVAPGVPRLCNRYAIPSPYPPMCAAPLSAPRVASSLSALPVALAAPVSSRSPCCASKSLVGGISISRACEGSWRASCRVRPRVRPRAGPDVRSDAPLLPSSLAQVESPWPNVRYLRPFSQ